MLDKEDRNGSGGEVGMGVGGGGGVIGDDAYMEYISRVAATLEMEKGNWY